MGYPIIGNSLVHAEIGVILPTYGESENIANLIEDIENLNLDASILVIDDSSPDGTADIVVEKQKKYPNLMLLNRPKKSGLGTAITDGFKIFSQPRLHQNTSSPWMQIIHITLKIYLSFWRK